MPIYEYGCNACGKRFEIRRSMQDAPLESCPECRGAIRRIFSGGSGFLIKNGVVESPIQTHCGRSQTCCGSSSPCEIPSCETS